MDFYFNEQLNQSTMSNQEFNNYTKTVLSTLDSSLKTVQEIKKIIPQRVSALRNEVYGYYRNIQESVFKQVFDEYYGKYYDKESLMSSLIFTMDNTKVYPNVTYNASKFRFLNSLERTQLDNGHDPSKVSTIDDFIDPDYEISYSGPFDEQEFADDADAIYWEEIGRDPFDFWNFNKLNNNFNNLALSPLDEVYKIALLRRQQEFLKQYNSSIKKRMESKYGITL